MAGKITDYGSLTGANAASDDLIEIVDVSDTTLAATGTNKKITQAELAIALETIAGWKGGASTLAARLGVISNFASPNAGGIISNGYYDNAFQGTASSTLAGAAGRIDLAPYYTSVPWTTNQIGAAVSSAVGGSTFKILIYSTDANGWPDARLYEGAAITSASTGYQSNADAFAFSAGVQYWIGTWHSSTATLRTINVSSAVNLGLGTSGSNATSYMTVVRRTVTYNTAANSAPATWSFVSTDLASATPPSVRMRAA